MDMEVTALDGEVSCIRLSGRLDATGVDRIETRFAMATARQGGKTIVDLSGVSFIASLGIRLLISSARNAGLKRGKLVLYGATELVQGVLEQMAIDQIMPIVASEAKAIEQAGA